MTRYPAEWEPQQRVWLAWPHNPKSWGDRPGICDFYVELIQAIRRFQPVTLLVPEGSGNRLPRGLRATAPYPLERLTLPTDDIWIRDYGPIFVEQDGMKRAVSFAFNGWGAKFPPWDNDNRVPSRITETLGVHHREHDLIFEGGAIEVNGNGLGVTTRDCLVGPNRNPETALATVTEAIRQALGLTHLLVLPKGLKGDHTDGHIDNVARFLGPNHVVIAREDDRTAANHRVLADAKSRIEAWRPLGRSLETSTLPLPPQRPLGKETLPASYMNFIFVNGGLIVPLFRVPEDDEALAFYRRVFPDREVLGIDCTLVIEEGGGLHCLSKQEPR